MTDALVQDLLPEILKRLPVKSLLRFECVEKSWHRLIKSPYFINLHSRHKKYSKNKFLLFQDRFNGRVSLRVDDKQCKEYYSQLHLPVPGDMAKRSNLLKKIYGTCRGLICFTISASDIPRVRQVYLWNPSTRISKTLPCTAIPCDGGTFMMGIAFGYFPENNDYKVIKIEKCNYDTTGEVKSKLYVCIYSLSTNSWKTVSKDSFTMFANYKLHNSVVISGVAYWVVGTKNGGRIICYDMEKETIREIMLPPQDSMKILYNVDLVEHSGKLVPYVIVFKPAESFDMLVLENEGEMDEVWTKKVTLDFDKIGGTFWPIGFRNSGELVLAFKLGKCKIRSYDLEKEEATEMGSYDLEKEETTEMVDDAHNLWSDSYFDPFSFSNGIHEPPNNALQPIYVNSFEENLVLLR